MYETITPELIHILELLFELPLHSAELGSDFDFTIAAILSRPVKSKMELIF
jgi:hypothetical protein